MKLTHAELEREYGSWTDEEVREHYVASRREAAHQFALKDRQSALYANLCRMSAERYSRKLLRRAKERSA